MLVLSAHHECTLELAAVAPATVPRWCADVRQRIAAGFQVSPRAEVPLAWGL